MLVLGSAFAVVVTILDPLSAVVGLVIMVPFYWWLFSSTWEPRMRAMASAARTASDPERQSTVSLAAGVAVRGLLLSAMMVALLLWSARGDGPAGIVGGVLLGQAMTTFRQVRWWRRWEDYYGVEMLYESGFRWREFWNGSAPSRCWVVLTGEDATSEPQRRRPTDTT